MTNHIQPGDILLFVFPKNNPKGHEQEGIRPAIVIVPPKENSRYPVTIVIPLTTQSGEWAHNTKLYRKIPAGEGGLPQDSIALIDQVRAMDVRRIKAYIGKVRSDVLEDIKKLLIDLIKEC
ncbi:growth inhibitor [Thermoanaerobacter kivui]|uniref:Growth inhibitor n=1 Tax=Thermoanaerobacter kivui TaxID=2325 RepID=A0A097AS27_THEKI|nr:type II toxin-antitoxin system PemK/MazF family toxin [Thermoanaerobacter kivui]AIS52626.1 growth inhibitor [Thermoanaerobacter kivui]